MSEQPTQSTSLAIPDAEEVRRFFESVTGEAQAAIGAVWQGVKDNDPQATMNALTIFNQRYEAIQTFGQQAVEVIAGATEVINELTEQRDQIQEQLDTLESQVDERIEEAYAMGHDEAFEDEYLYEEMAEEAVEMDRQSFIIDSEAAAHHLREAGDVAAADELEQKAGLAIQARDDADALIARGVRIGHEQFMAELREHGSLMPPLSDDDEDEDGEDDEDDAA